MPELEEKKNASTSLLVTREPDVGPVAMLGDREHPWTSLGAHCQPALLPARESCLQISSPSRTLPRSYF